MYYTYVLYSTELDRYYIGFTGEEILDRVQKHLANHSGFTGKAKDWQLVYKETFKTKTEAMQRERQLKNWKNKQRIKELVERNSIE